MKKKLEYYLNIDYPVVIEKHVDDTETVYTAHCVELGKNECYGKGNSVPEAYDGFMKEKDVFIKQLYSANQPIPELHDPKLNFMGYGINIRYVVDINGKKVNVWDEFNRKLYKDYETAKQAWDNIPDCYKERTDKCRVILYNGVVLEELK